MLEEPKLRRILGEAGCLSVWQGDDAEILVLPIFRTPIVTLLWRWWSAGNKTNAREKKLSGREVVSHVLYHLADFERLKEKSTGARQAGTHQWQPPPAEIYKINIDAMVPSWRVGAAVCKGCQVRFKGRR